MKRLATDVSISVHVSYELFVHESSFYKTWTVCYCCCLAVRCVTSCSFTILLSRLLTRFQYIVHFAIQNNEKKLLLFVLHRIRFPYGRATGECVCVCGGGTINFRKEIKITVETKRQKKRQRNNNNNKNAIDTQQTSQHECVGAYETAWETPCLLCGYRVPAIGCVAAAAASAAVLQPDYYSSVMILKTNRSVVGQALSRQHVWTRSRSHTVRLCRYPRFTYQSFDK